MKLKQIYEAWATMTKHKTLSYIFIRPPFFLTFPDSQNLFTFS